MSDTCIIFSPEGLRGPSVGFRSAAWRRFRRRGWARSPPPAVTPNRRRGLALAFAAATTTAISIIPFKLATEESDPAHVVVVLVGGAAVFNSLGSGVQVLRRRRVPRQGAPVDWRVMAGVALALGVLGAVANLTASEAVARLDASISALLIQMQVIFAALLGWLWLREGVSARFALGTAIALAGIAVMAEGDGSGGAAVSGIGWGLIGAAGFGSIQVITRRYIDRIEPVWVNAIRMWLAVGLLALVPGSLAGAVDLPARSVGYALLAALIGPSWGRLMLMASARHIPAAMSTFIGFGTPVIALIGDWLILDGLPPLRAWLGGVVVALGMLVAVWTRSAPAPVADSTGTRPA